MACIINAESGTGLTNSADGSGILKLQSAGKTTNALAWVNFNGTGTVAIRSSYNVSSITDRGTGAYTVNFATAMPDANYSALWSNECGTAGFVGAGWIESGGVSAGSLQVQSYRQSAAGAGAAIDTPNGMVAVFGN